MTPGREEIGDLFHATRRVQLRYVVEDVLVFARRANALPPPLAHKPGVFGAKFRRELERGDRVVASHADVILTACLHRVLDVLDEVRRRRLAAGSQERHRVYADDATLRRQQP